MLDHVSISHESGLILWSRSFNPTFTNLSKSTTSPINHLIKDVIIENKAIVARSEDEGIEKDGFSVRWTVENGLELVFVVVFPALLPLTYIPSFLNRLKALFVALFQPYLSILLTSLSSQSTALLSSTQSALANLQSKIQSDRWEAIFDRCLKSFESSSASSTFGKKMLLNRQLSATPQGSPLSRKAQLNASQAITKTGTGSGTETETDKEQDGKKPLSAEEIAKNVKALAIKGKNGKPGGGGGGGGGGKGSPRNSRQNSSSPAGSPSRTNSSSNTAKIMRKWGDNHVNDLPDDAVLDYSAPEPVSTPGLDGSPGSSTPGTPAVDLDALVSNDALGTVKAGLYEVAEWDARGGKSKEEEGLPSEEEILARATRGSRVKGSDSVDDTTTEEVSEPSSSTGGIAGLFSRFTGKKTLSKEDLQPVLEEMEKHLMGKNVAKDIAEKVCESVGVALVGRKLGGFSSIKSEVNTAMSSAITRILTSKTSTDILLDIKRKASQPLPPSLSGEPLKDPYTMTFVGVNGVGKSTNLSKVCFWLLQNKLRVLIAACDTFRSGAVEQLRVHVRNLSLLGDELGMGGGSNGMSAEKKVELYERGYGKDAAGIARDAIAYAKENKYDVVLIDTAGRMQDNEPLMRALAKLVSVNNPDKIIFVGEALVGNEAVDQLSKFDRSLKDFSSTSHGGNNAQGKAKARGIDGMILTKFDTIDDKVGAALSMTYITGQPILFVGCGQTYTDLRHLRVNHIVQALLSA